jgi:hypothetical protein
MTTAYTSLLGLALPVDGELTGTWGQTVNNSITSLLDTAIAGTKTADVTSSDWTLTDIDGADAGTARAAVLIPTGTNGATTRSILAPNQSKIYVIINQATGSVAIKGVTGPTTGVTITSGSKAIVAWNGSDFVEVSPGTVTSVAATVPSFLSVSGSPITSSGTLAISLSGTALPVANGGTGSTSTTYCSLSTNVSGTLPVANGGTGTTSPALVAGTNVTISGTWPNQTINATSSGGTVTSVTGTAPVVSSGGTTPAISMAAATTSVNGYLTSTDWNTFNGKLSTTGGTMTGNLTLDAYTEKVATLATSGSIALNPSTGTTLSCAAAGTVTFTDSLSSGQSISLLLTNGSSYTINWPAGTTWVTAAGNTAPTLSASNTLVFWKISSTLYGALVGKSA